MNTMGIPESQFETWSHQGAITSSKATHESIRNALVANSSPVKDKNFEIYLQGSYKNDTNIHGESDVDVVVQLNSTFHYDLSALPGNESLLFKQIYPSAAIYLWNNFRADVLNALRAYCGASKISEGNKSLKAGEESGRLPADIVVCLQYRKYQRFLSQSYEQFVEGIILYTLRENRIVINFPKSHYDNGVEKNASTNGWYKPTVRVLKNARTYLINHNLIEGSLASSYFIECLLYNVPNSQFGGNYQVTFCNIVNWLEEVDFNGFICQNKQLLLFGDSQEQWSINEAKQFVSALIHLWNIW